MTPSTPPRTAAEQAELDAAALRAQEVIAPVEVVKQSQEVQDTAHAAADKVAGAVTKAAGLVSRNVTTVAEDLKAADAERAEQKKRDNARQDKADDQKHWLSIYSLWAQGLTAVALAAISSVAAYYGISNANRIDRQGATIEKTHDKVNSAMRHQLFATVVYLKRIAAFSKDPGDQEALQVAEAALEEHDRNQAKEDAKNP